MNILIQFPTKWRSKQFLEVLEKYFKKLSGLHDVRVQVISDTDDPQMARHEVEQNVKIVTDDKYWFRRGVHRTKIAAVNSHMASSIDGWTWDICVLASDDMVPLIQGYDDIIVRNMKRFFPDTDGVLWFNDGYAGHRLNTLAICGRKYYERWGYIYYPGLASFFADNDWQGRAEQLNRQVYINDVIIRHEHPYNLHREDFKKRAGWDNLYRKNDTTWDRDREAYEAHRDKRFDIPLLDILICTVENRAEHLSRLTEELKRQIGHCNAWTNVRILTELDAKKATIGEKRNRLLDRSRSEYLCFLDDDDNVGSTYVRRILDAIGCCDVDCIGIVGRVIDRNYGWSPFVHSIEHRGYNRMVDGTYLRPPNHLNPIRRSIATKYRFDHVNHGEDTRWAMHICRDLVLRKQRMIKVPIYYYVPSHVRGTLGITAWSKVVMDRIARDHQPYRPTAQISPVAPAGTEPSSRIGPPVVLGQTAPENVPGLFPQHRKATGHHTWEGPAWLKKKRQLQARMRAPRARTKEGVAG